MNPDFKKTLNGFYSKLKSQRTFHIVPVSLRDYVLFDDSLVTRYRGAILTASLR